MNTKINITRLADTASVLLIVTGFILFFYGMVVSDQTIYYAMLSLQASILGTDVATQSPVVSEAESAFWIFFTALSMIAAGAVFHMYQRYFLRASSRK